MGGNTSGKGHGMAEMADALRAGMTPILSYWDSKNMLWLDGMGPDLKGPCRQDLVVPCPANGVHMYDFSVEPSITSSPWSRAHHKFWVLAAALVGLAICAGLAVYAKSYRSFKDSDSESESESDQE